jgi:hypothetical protein
MAEVRGYFSSDFIDEPVILRNPEDDLEEIKHSGYFAYHDIHAPSLVVGLSKGENIGAVIYQKSGVSKDPFEAFLSIGDMIKTENITGRIKPFFHSEGIPIKLDSGEAGILTLVHLPLVRITAVIVNT